MKHPNWDKETPAEQFKNIRRNIGYLMDSWNRLGKEIDESIDFSLEMQNLINQLAYLQPYLDGNKEWNKGGSVLPCSGPKCEHRRIHHERQDTPRGTQFIEVPKDYKGERAFCSLTCKMYYEGENETPKT